MEQSIINNKERNTIISKAIELGKSIRNNNNETRYKLLKYFWDLDLMEIHDDITEEVLMSIETLEEKLELLVWKSYTKLGYQCMFACQGEYFI